MANSVSSVTTQERFVLGLDLDGVCADFYGKMREIAAEWTEQPLESLAVEPEWGLSNWGIGAANYDRFHRFAVTQRGLFETMKPIPGAASGVRRLGTEGVRVRIITHRLFIRYFHEVAVQQTVRWLDHWSIPYWDLCFMRDKGDVGADLYVDDSPTNIEDLEARGKEVLIFSNATNIGVSSVSDRAENWTEAEDKIRTVYYRWLQGQGFDLPAGPGIEPEWAKSGPRPAV
jgi:5'(3')-deoxyribonucleotidase